MLEVRDEKALYTSLRNQLIKAVLMPASACIGGIAIPAVVLICLQIKNTIVVTWEELTFLIRKAAV